MSKDIFDSIDQAIEINEKLSSENNRLTMALQDIRECYAGCHQDNQEAADMVAIASKALEGEEEPGVKVNHEGHLYVFGESTIEVEYIGSKDDFPFRRVGKELDK